MISEAMLSGFIDEMEKISSFQTNVAGAVTKFGTRAAGFAKGVGSNIGGTAKAFANPIQGLKTGWTATKNDIKGGHPAMTGLLLLGAGLDAKNAIKKEDPSGKGLSRTSRVSRLAGSIGGGIIGSPFGISGGIAGSMAGEVAGRLAGKGLDKLRGRRPAAPVPQPQPQLGQQGVIP